MENNENNLENEKDFSAEENIQEPSNKNPVLEDQPQEKKKKGFTKKEKMILSIFVVLIGVLSCIYLGLLKEEKSKTTKYDNTEVAEENVGEEVEEEESEETEVGNDSNDYVQLEKEEEQGDGDTSYKRTYNNPLTSLDIRFLQLENNGKDKVYSPLSIKVALKMLSDATNGKTKSQIDNILGDYNVNKYPNDKRMSFANSMFIKNSFKNSVKKNYIDLLKNRYDAEVIFDEFSSPKNINKWISDKTFNIIDKMFKDDKDISEKDFFLINALAIDLNWVNQIHCTSGNSSVPCVNNGMYTVDYKHEKLDDKATSSYHVAEYSYNSDADFTKIKFDGKMKVPTSEVLADYNRYDIIKDLGEKKIKDIVRVEYKKYLESNAGKSDVKNGYAETDVEKYLDQFVKEIKENYGKAEYSTDFYVYEDGNVKTFAKNLKKYNNIQLQYVGIMPKTKTLNNYVRDLSINDVNNIIKNMKNMNIKNFKEGYATVIRGNIPFFKIEYELKILEDLQKLGVKDVFEMGKADLSKLTSIKEEFIDEVNHKADIEFSNYGIRAAAATSASGAGATSGGFDYQFKIPVQKIDVTFNKPYMYIIRDKESGEVWFAGTVYNPKTSIN
jgi:serine protease inhibitor